MKLSSPLTIAGNLLSLSLCTLLLYPALAQAQIGLPVPTIAGPAVAAKAAAPVDFTGTWVSIVNEDWRWRMRTPAKGDYDSVLTLNADGRAEADKWEVSQDGSCKAFGAAGLMRMPTRLQISWADDFTLKIVSDAGMQTRLLRFTASGGIAAAPASPSLQGFSLASWQLPASYRPGPNAAPPANGSLSVTTTNMIPAWLRRNGVPYSAQTVLTEYFDTFAIPGGERWLVVTSIVDDPVFHNGRFITSSHFRHEADNAKWNPEACKND